MADDNGDVYGIGCLVVIALIIWGLWSFFTGCVISDGIDYLTEHCAINHLRMAGCSDERQITEIVSILDMSTKDEKTGRRMELRKVIFEYRKLPGEHPVSAELMRDTAYFYKAQGGEWKATCEIQK